MLLFLGPRKVGTPNVEEPKDIRGEGKLRWIEEESRMSVTLRLLNQFPVS